MDTNLSQPVRLLSQCSMTLRHSIRTFPIGTRAASNIWLAVRTISLFTHSFFVYSTVYGTCNYSYIFVFLIYFPNPFDFTVFDMATSFNQNISNWNTGSVTTMEDSMYHLSFHPFCFLFIIYTYTYPVFLMFSFCFVFLFFN